MPPSFKRATGRANPAHWKSSTSYWEAALQVNQSLKMNPKQNEVLTNLGFAYLKMKNTELALKLYDQALALDPNFEQTLLNKAGLYNFLGKTKEAKILLHQILKLNPHNEQVKIVLQKM